MVLYCSLIGMNHFMEALPLSYKKNSETRFCRISRKCGACQLQNMSYPQQLSWKMAKTIKLLSRFGHVEEIIGMETPYHYRNKAQAAFGRTARGKMISGIYQSGTHIIAATDQCFLESAKADEIIVTIRCLAESFKIQVYNEDTHAGCLRHVLVRNGAVSGQILVAIVTATPVFPGKTNFVRELVKLHPEITTVVQNINPAHDSMVLGKRQVVLYGKGYIEDTLCGCVFRISARSFYQINSIQTEKLYQIALEYADLSKNDILLDAYCGIGTIGLIAAKQSGCQVIGVESNEDAAREAGANGGTVVTSRRIGNEQALGFWGMSIQNEKDMVFIVAENETKLDIMKAIGEKCGLHSEAQGVLVSLPIDHVIGFETAE